MMLIETMLVLSIDHLRSETRDALNGANGPLTETWGPQLAWEHGWIWWVGGENPVVIYDFPQEFAAIFSFAMKHGCTWVRFDEDGAKIPDLPLYGS